MRWVEGDLVVPSPQTSEERRSSGVLKVASFQNRMTAVWQKYSIPVVDIKTWATATENMKISGVPGGGLIG